MATYTCTSNTYALTNSVVTQIASEDDQREYIALTYSFNQSGPIYIGGSTVTTSDLLLTTTNNQPYFVLTGNAAKPAFYATTSAANSGISVLQTTVQ